MNYSVLFINYIINSDTDIPICICVVLNVYIQNQHIFFIK